MTSSSSKSPPKRGQRAKPGTADHGRPFDPTQLEEQRTPKSGVDDSRPAPAPGVPISDQQYEWLKRKAETVRLPPSKHKQEDPSGKK